MRLLSCDQKRFANEKLLGRDVDWRLDSEPESMIVATLQGEVWERRGKGNAAVVRFTRLLSALALTNSVENMISDMILMNTRVA